MNCCKEFTIGITPAPSCGESTDWTNNPGSCRLRVKDFNSSDWVIGGCPGISFGSTPWDGTFSYFNAAFGQYQISQSGTPTFYLNTRYLKFSCRIALIPAPFLQYWRVELTAFGEPDWMYVAQKAASGGTPLGVYNVVLSETCMVLPASIEIEGYTP